MSVVYHRQTPVKYNIPVWPCRTELLFRSW